MKRKMAVLLAVCMTAAGIWGCGSQETNKSTKIETVEAKEESKDAVKEEEETVPAVSITPVETTAEAPAKIGEWVATKKPSSVDNQFHTVYYRITDVVRDEAEVMAAVEASGSTFEPDPLDEHLEYCMLTYEVYFPSDFPQEEAGIMDTGLSFYVENPNGFNYFEADEGSYQFYSGSATDISEWPDVFELNAGEIFTEGKAVFAMVKDGSDYIFETSYMTQTGEIGRSYIAGK